MWEGLGKLEGKQGNVSQAGLDKVKSHIELFGDNELKWTDTLSDAC